MTPSLRPYQQEAVDFIGSRPHSGLLIDMGLGKTLAVLSAASKLKFPILIVSTIRVIETVWEAEARKWGFNYSFTVLRGTPAEREALLREPSDFYLVNPELLEKLMQDPESQKIRSVVFDESTLYKNPSTQRFKKQRKYLSRFDHRLILTGTFTANSLLDVWAQIFLLDQGQRLGTSYFNFRQRFFYQTDYMGYSWAPRPGAAEKIVSLISDLVLRIPAEGNLPPREVVDNELKIQLPKEARRQYDSMARQALAILANTDRITAANAAAALMKLRQMASGFVYTDAGGIAELHNEKIQAVKEILEETGSPVILLYHFQHELAALQRTFPQGRVISSDIIDPWNNGEIPLLFLHPQSGGHGLNLQDGGHTMIIFTATFSFDQMSQAKARIDRQGQRHPVVFHNLVAEGTVDELVHDVIRSKCTDQTQLMKMVKDYATNHSRRP